MPISHIFAEGIGPFKKVHLDLRGPDGRASYGPHILAGVNGSGKSTLLKALAWCVAKEEDGFPIEEWKQFLSGHAVSRVMVVIEVGKSSWVRAITNEWENGWDSSLSGWVSETLRQLLPPFSLTKFMRTKRAQPGSNGLAFYNSTEDAFNPPHNWAAYSPSKALSHLDQIKVSSRATDSKNRLSFDRTVSNEDVQEWLVALYSRRAIARERHEETGKYTATFNALERGLQRVCGDHVSIIVDIEPQLLPKLRIGSQILNFSQVPDGIRSTLGWLTDFMMRSERLDWQGDKRRGVLLFDEIETFLHPRWQRSVLPAMRAALPDTQFLVTSHSPFVISSCRDAMVHVLKIGSDGYAYAEPPVKAPIGESITATLKDIFGVDSRFDVETEDELKEWNGLQKARTSHKLSAKKESRFKELTQTLGSRSEELHSIVNPVPKLAKSMVDSLTGAIPVRSSRPKRAASR